MCAEVGQVQILVPFVLVLCSREESAEVDLAIDKFDDLLSSHFLDVFDRGRGGCLFSHVTRGILS